MELFPVEVSIVGIIVLVAGRFFSLGGFSNDVAFALLLLVFLVPLLVYLITSRRIDHVENDTDRFEGFFRILQVLVNRVNDLTEILRHLRTDNDYDSHKTKFTTKNYSDEEDNYNPN